MSPDDAPRNRWDSDRHRALEQTVEGLLRSLQFDYAREPTIRGVRVDFVVYGREPKDGFVVLELKSGVDALMHLQRAGDLALRYRYLTGARRVFVLFDHSATYTDEALDWGLRFMLPDELPAALLEEFSGTPQTPVASTNEIRTGDIGLIFSAMPFRREYDDVYFVAIAGAAYSLGLTSLRVDHAEFVGDVVGYIKQSIRGARFVVADVSEGRPNVLFEYGFADALGVDVVPVCRTPLREIPFDVSHDNIIQYHEGGTMKLASMLVRRLSSLMWVPPPPLQIPARH